MSEVEATRPAKRGLFRKKAAAGQSVSVGATPSWDDDDDMWDESSDLSPAAAAAETAPQAASPELSTTPRTAQRVRPKRSSADLFKQRSWEDTGWDDGGWDDEWSDPSLRVSVPSAASPRSEQVDAWLNNSADQGEITKDITVKWAGPDANRMPPPGATWDHDSEQPALVERQIVDSMSPDLHDHDAIGMSDQTDQQTDHQTDQQTDQQTEVGAVEVAGVIEDDEEWEDTALDDELGDDDLDELDDDDTPSHPMLLTDSSANPTGLEEVRAALSAIRTDAAVAPPDRPATADSEATAQPPVADQTPTIHPAAVDVALTVHSAATPADGSASEDSRFAAFASLAPAAASVATTAGLGLALVAGGRTLLGLTEGSAIAKQGRFDVLHRIGSVFSRIGSLQGLLILLAIAFVTLPLLVDDEAEEESASAAGIALGICIVAALITLLGAILAFRYDVKTHDLGVSGLTASSWLRSSGDLLAAGGTALVAFVAAVMALRARTSE